MVIQNHLNATLKVITISTFYVNYQYFPHDCMSVILLLIRICCGSSGCSSEFRKKYALARHRVCHVSEKKIYCACGNKYKSNHSLMIHMRRCKNVCDLVKSQEFTMIMKTIFNEIDEYRSSFCANFGTVSL